MGAAHDRNHKDIRIREEAKDRMRSGIIIIAVVIVIGAIGFSSVCFFLNKFMGV
jgi:flagellar basal body-associated protein FliL